MNQNSTAKWVKSAREHLAMEKCLSLDFWNTICILNASPRQIRTQACIDILSEFHITARGEELIILFDRTAKGYSQINQKLNGSEEYSAKLVWFLIGITYFKSQALAEKFSNRAMEIELNNFNKYSKISLQCSDFLVENNNNKKVFILSDFEYGSDFLKKMLSLKGIETNLNFYVSSELNLSKASGTLYEYIKKLGYVDILHIGDNRHSDYLIAKKHNIKAILVTKHKNNFVLRSRKVLSGLSKLVLKLQRIPILPVSQARYFDFLLMLSSDWRRRILDQMDGDTTLLFVGSEGAFASNLLSNHELLSTSRSIYLNFGRKVVLEASIGSLPLYPISKLIMENLEWGDICSFLHIEHSREQEYFEYLRLGEYSQFDDLKLEFSKSNSLEVISKILPNKNEKLLVIDIGYQASFASCLIFLGYSSVYVAQMFGKYSARAIFDNTGTKDFGTAIKEIYYLDNYPYVDVDLVEGFFSMGPRSPKVNSYITSLRQKIVSDTIRISSQNSNLGSYSKIHKRMGFPPLRFMQEFMKARFPSDEVNSNFKAFSRLPWSAVYDKRILTWNFHLIIKYLRRAISKRFF